MLGYFSQYNMNPFTTEVDLEVNTAQGLDKILAGVVSPNGEAFFKTDPLTGEFARDADGRLISAFSWDFDAIEIFNGKRLELLRHYRLPKAKIRELYLQALTDQYLEAGDTEEEAQRKASGEVDSLLAELPEEAIVCDGDELSFPGQLDDWYNLLNSLRPDGTYRRYTATGNSDSHKGASPSEHFPGFPRNYFWVGHDDASRITDDQLVDAIQSHRNIVTNGPFVTMTVDDQPIGSTVTASSATVRLAIEVQAADWVGADRYRVVANGEEVARGAWSWWTGAGRRRWIWTCRETLGLSSRSRATATCSRCCPPTRNPPSICRRRLAASPGPSGSTWRRSAAPADLPDAALRLYQPHLGSGRRRRHLPPRLASPLSRPARAASSSRRPSPPGWCTPTRSRPCVAAWPASATRVRFARPRSSATPRGSARDVRTLFEMWGHH